MRILCFCITISNSILLQRVLWPKQNKNKTQLNEWMNRSGNDFCTQVTNSKIVPVWFWFWILDLQRRKNHFPGLYVRINHGPPKRRKCSEFDFWLIEKNEDWRSNCSISYWFWRELPTVIIIMEIVLHNFTILNTFILSCLLHRSWKCGTVEITRIHDLSATWLLFGALLG